jgi:hypothetical protein
LCRRIAGSASPFEESPGDTGNLGFESGKKKIDKCSESLFNRRMNQIQN